MKKLFVIIVAVFSVLAGVIAADAADAAKPNSWWLGKWEGRWGTFETAASIETIAPSGEVEATYSWGVLRGAAQGDPADSMPVKGRLIGPENKVVLEWERRGKRKLTLTVIDENSLKAEFWVFGQAPNVTEFHRVQP